MSCCHTSTGCPSCPSAASQSRRSRPSGRWLLSRGSQAWCWSADGRTSRCRSWRGIAVMLVGGLGVRGTGRRLQRGRRHLRRPQRNRLAAVHDCRRSRRRATQCPLAADRDRHGRFRVCRDWARALSPAQPCARRSTFTSSPPPERRAWRAPTTIRTPAAMAWEAAALLAVGLVAIETRRALTRAVAGMHRRHGHGDDPDPEPRRDRWGRHRHGRGRRPGVDRCAGAALALGSLARRRSWWSSHC